MDFMECMRPSCTCDVQRPSLTHGITCDFPSRDDVRCGALSHSVASCGKKELNANVVLKMPRNNHDIMDGAFDCRMCERVFKTEDELEKHLQNHDEHRPYKCPQCNKGFKQPCHLNQHLRTHTDERPFPCEVCRKSFKQACQLKQHMRLHTGEKPYHCSECSRAFKQASQLNQHVRLHTGEKPYKCNHCDKTFTQASQLRSHKKTHDPKPERKPVSKRPKAIPRGHVVMPFPEKMPVPQSMPMPQKPPYFSPNMKLDPNLSFKPTLTPYGSDRAPVQMCRVRELPVTTMPTDFQVE